jgi:hypothetical protein
MIGDKVEKIARMRKNFKDYYSLNEAAEALDCDVETLLQRAANPDKYHIHWPRISFFSTSRSLLANGSNLENVIYSLINSDLYDPLRKDKIYYNESYTSTFVRLDLNDFFIHPESILFIIKNGFIPVYTPESLDLTGFISNQTIYPKQIRIFFEDGSPYNEFSGRFYFEESFDRELTIDDLFITHDQLVRFDSEQKNYIERLETAEKEIENFNMTQSRKDLDCVKNNEYLAIAELEKVKAYVISLESRNSELLASNEILRSDLERINKVFGEGIKNVLYPVAMAIHNFSESSVYATILDERGKADKVNSKGLENVRLWVKYNTEFKADRNSDFIKDLINAYYKLK